jgi:glycosyltransferase involved in cell wall biosynthesis
MTIPEIPRVDVALPVFNGEQYLAEAIESILNQTYDQFRLLIFDNASTDGTTKICQHYAAVDRRVTYTRNANNVGAAPNFNLAFRASRSEYFKWHAHDDLLMPTFLSTAVKCLDENQWAVLFQSMTRFIDGAGKHIGDAEAVVGDMGHSNVARRFAAHLSSPGIWAIYGLLKAEQLRRTRGFQSYQYADWLLLGELALLGPFVTCREPLFINRHHAGQYYNRAALRAHECSNWWDTRKAHDVRFHQWIHLGGYLQAIRLHVPDRKERIRCYGHFIRSLVRRRHATRLAVGLIGAVDPRAATAVKRLLRERVHARRLET